MVLKVKEADTMKKELLEIAKKNSFAVETRGDLESRCNDEDDFIEVSVWSLEKMLEEAYKAGQASKRGANND